MNVTKFVSILNDIAPFFLQEQYDNSGIQIVDLDADIQKVLISLDLTSDIVDEAIQNKANVILSHHPIMFSTVKNITKQKNPALFKAIVNNINLVAMHTNFDLAEDGLNDYVGKLLGIKKIKPIKRRAEKTYKFAVYVPVDYADKVRNALFGAGAGKIGNYGETSFNLQGSGTFTPLDGTDPFIGKKGKKEKVKEIKIETVVFERNINSVLMAMKKVHPYEEPAYDIYEIIGRPSSGIGMVGEVKKQRLKDFARFVKARLDAKHVRLIGAKDVFVRRVALCTGGGISLLNEVQNLGVDIYITGDITHHAALSAQEIDLNLLDVEHFDTEKFFVDAIYEHLVDRGIPGKVLLKSKKMQSPYTVL
jgi:dinuclear metal center YbgI/SA1388 family protein